MKYTKYIGAFCLIFFTASMAWIGATQEILPAENFEQQITAEGTLSEELSESNLAQQTFALSAPAPQTVSGNDITEQENTEAAEAQAVSDSDAEVVQAENEETDAAEGMDAVPAQEEAPAEESEYADLAIADVTDYVNVRTEPNTDSAIVGKIYDGAVAHILETAGEENDWFKVSSGNVEGYIKAEFFLYGEEAVSVIEEYVTRYAVVQADRLNIREEPTTEAKRIGYVNNGERVKLVENMGDWVKVQYTSEKVGYVSAEYVTLTEEFLYAKSLEEEAAELAARREREERQHVSEEKAGENVTISVTSPSGEYATTDELRTAIVDYAMQFLGNKYIHGGQSLVTGTDCSGFTSLIYKEFGYSVSRTPGGQLSGDGRSIAYEDIKPGDIICYGKTKCTHVALYIGDGQIIHSANSRKGVVIYEADYDNILGVKSIVE